MRPSPRFLGAVTAVLVTGVGSGALIGNVPPIRQIGLEDVIPEARHVASAFPQEPAPRDQYPIETPEGRFEIEELSERGLYRNARFAWSYAYDDPASLELEAAYAQVPDAPPAAELPTVTEADETVADPAADPPPEAADAQTGPAVASAGPRIVDVAAELAEQRRAE